MFCQNALLHLPSPFRKDKTIQVKAASCSYYSRFPYDFVYFTIRMPPFSASDWLFLAWLSQWLPPPPFSALLIVSSPVTNSLFSCFAESSSGSSWDVTNNNSGGLPPFKCFAKNTSKAIYNNSSYGPSFGDLPGLRITCSNQNTSANAQASISKPCSVPSEVDNSKEILTCTSESFFPNSYEVFCLS